LTVRRLLPTLRSVQERDGEGRRRRIALLLILGGLSAFGPLSTDFYLPGLPEMTSALGGSASSGQVTLTGCLIGMGLGQLAFGPVSDSHGRRVPLLIGLVVFVAASVACAAATSIPALIGIRFVQGCAGGAGIVIAMSVVRDLHGLVGSARVFALLLLTTGVVPMLAPSVGALLLGVTSWRGLFVVLAAVGAVLLVGSIFFVPETLSPQRRRSGGLAAALRVMSGLLRDGAFLAHTAAVSFAFAAAFAYISASPFVLENVYGLSPQEFGAVFAFNSGCFVAVAQVGGRLAGSVGPRRLLLVGLWTAGAGGVLSLLAVAGGLGFAPLLVGLALVQGGNGLTVPNATALALADHPEAAGTASALVGLGRFGFAAVVAPLVGVAGAHSGLPMGIAIAALSVSALVIHLAFGRDERRKAVRFRRAKTPS
jgi:DHA1 family bicyclomycin/chloramphenicol resistance-like MFS transporter